MLRVADAPQVCFFHAQLPMEIRLTRALPCLPVPHDQLCRADRACLLDRAPRLLDLCHQPVPG